jgi:hypothetical protein
MTNRDRAAGRIDDAGKLHQQAVTGGLVTKRPYCSGDLWIEKLAPQRSQALEVPPSSAPISRE